MPNIRSKINKRSQQKNTTTQAHRATNCLVKENCPMNGLCLTSSILYQATIKCSDSRYKQKRYKGICETTFKKLQKIIQLNQV